MDRRGFLGSILALGVAPAIVRAGSLMRIAPPKMPSVGIIIGESSGWMEPGSEQAMIDLMNARIAAAKRMMIQQITTGLYLPREQGISIVSLD
jgi:hypothetical protein